MFSQTICPFSGATGALHKAVESENVLTTIFKHPYTVLFCVKAVHQCGTYIGSSSLL